MVEVHFGWKLKNITVQKTNHGTDRIAYFQDASGSEIKLRFGSFLLTPDNKKRSLYEGNDIADEHVYNV